MGTKFWGKGFLGKVLWGQNVGDKDFEITFVAQKRVEERFSSGEENFEILRLGTKNWGTNFGETFLGQI